MDVRLLGQCTKLVRNEYPNKGTGTKNCLSNAKLCFWKKGASLHIGKTSTKGGRQSILPFIPDVQSLPLDLEWPRSKVHTLPFQLKFYTYLGEVLRYTV
jgi:hypothetical protein